ncbi:MAG: hypothetical protein KA397_06650 [Paludibacteraceae bacterium]|nr:hypothetical protein [Paludibacteraceae bacterium]MBP6284783.1 hypothetical protein [Paludibacteraceae bacterium]
MKKNILIDQMLKDIEELDIILNSLRRTTAVNSVISTLVRYKFRYLEANFTELLNDMPEEEILEPSPTNSKIEEIEEIKKSFVVADPVVIEEPVSHTVFFDEDMEETPDFTVVAKEEPAPPLVTPIMKEEKSKFSKPNLATKMGAVDARLVTDLRRAIGINDRFRFKRELFGGNEQIMMETIDLLNKCSSLEEAEEYLDTHFDMQKENDSYLYFIEILHKRFAHISA